MWSNLMDELLKILRNNNKIYESHPYEDPDFDGEPAATITPSGNSGSYNTTSENERVYAFTVRLFIDRETSISGKDPYKDADRRMRNLVDSVLDDFDKNYDLPNLNEPSGYVFTHLFASPSTWGYVQRENNYRIAEIEIEARVQVDVTTIT